MRVVIVYDSAQFRQQMVARAVQGSLQNRNHTADLRLLSEEAKLSGYHYIIFISGTISFFRGKIPPKIAQYLSHAGPLMGKKGAAIIVKRPSFGQLRGMKNLMKVMEQEGITVHYSDIVHKAAELFQFCSTLG